MIDRIKLEHIINMYSKDLSTYTVPCYQKMLLRDKICSVGQCSTCSTDRNYIFLKKFK